MSDTTPAMTALTVATMLVMVAVVETRKVHGSAAEYQQDAESSDSIREDDENCDGDGGGNSNVSVPAQATPNLQLLPYAPATEPLPDDLEYFYHEHPTTPYALRIGATQTEQQHDGAEEDVNASDDESTEDDFDEV